MIVLVAILALMAVGGVAFAFAGGDERTQKRVNTFVKARDGGRNASRAQIEANQKRKSVATLLKDVEKNQAAMREKNRPTLRRRLEQAGFDGNPRNFWILSGALAVMTALICLVTGQSKLVMLLTPIGIGFGLPRWVLNFLFARRKKRFTREFAGAIDVIVRSVKSGLPTNEALRIVARETPDPVGAEFTRLVDGLKVGITLEQGLKKMHENMPTADVGFFGIVMTIQAKSGGNLSEALSNLAGVLRDRKRLEGKIKAMSSEAKASAMIIGSLPPAVMTLVWLTTPEYINMLFNQRVGNLLLLGCGLWMGIGIFVMRGMINFKH
ncbi:MAG: type II secretion system F family protein [Alphaproteobacteria bacterium]|jgi:tight adherence protein B|nr:type II secretion system F family protein [Alphaproteobacteria bacterium]